MKKIIIMLIFIITFMCCSCSKKSEIISIDSDNYTDYFTLKQKVTKPMHNDDIVVTDTSMCYSDTYAYIYIEIIPNSNVKINRVELSCNAKVNVWYSKYSKSLYGYESISTTETKLCDDIVFNELVTSYKFKYKKENLHAIYNEGLTINSISGTITIN